MSNQKDIAVLRELARQYAQIAANPEQQKKRKLWTQHNSLKKTRVPILATYGMWNVWCREVFGEHALKCQDPFYRMHEQRLRMDIFQDSVGDDFILEPWITQGTAQKAGWSDLWGVQTGLARSSVEGGAGHYNAAIKDWKDVAKLRAPGHVIDEAETARCLGRLQEAIGDILPVNLDRGTACAGFMADISYGVTMLRGLEQIMVDMYDSPRELHNLLAFMRDGVLAIQDECEKAGDFGLTSQQNQAMTYAEELEPPAANVRPRKRKDLWAFCAAQEFTLISPQMHDEFLLQYQLPIISKWGLSAYGCCENLTNKIDMLRQIPNLRIIAVTPTADVAKCAQQIGKDYVVSWRPNPAEMVCCGYDESRIRRIIRAGLEACRGCHVHIHLKDIETLEGDTQRLARWVGLVRQIADEVAP